MPQLLPDTSGAASDLIASTVTAVLQKFKYKVIGYKYSGVQNRLALVSRYQLQVGQY